MSAVYTKVIYDCECHPFCSEKSYFKIEEDNAGLTLISQCIHCVPFGDNKETVIGLFNSAEVKALGQILTDKEL